MTQDPTLAEALADAFEARLLDVHVSMICRVTAYDASTQRVSVQAVNQRAYVDESDETQVENFPVFQDVPVAFAGTATDNITWPIAVGDTCVVVFSENSNGAWLRRGGGPIDPQDYRRHSLSDGTAWFGVRDFAHPLRLVPTDAVVITAATELRLGDQSASGAAAAVALRSTLDEFMSVLSTVTDAAGACAALHTALAAALWPTNFVASKVKAV